MSREPSDKGRPPLTAWQLAGVVLVMLVLVVVVDFSQRLAASQRLVDSAAEVQGEVAVLEREHTALRTQVAYATTDAAVVAWAHEHGRMIQPGEVLVVPLLPTPAATPVPAPVTLPPPPPNYALWWATFFGSVP